MELYHFKNILNVKLYIDHHHHHNNMFNKQQQDNNNNIQLPLQDQKKKKLH